MVGKNERSRVRRNNSISSDYCSNFDLHSSYHVSSIKNNFKVKKCYNCKPSFTLIIDALAARTKSCQSYYDPKTLNLTVSKTLHNVYVHLGGLDHQEFKDEPFHLCDSL